MSQGSKGGLSEGRPEVVEIRRLLQQGCETLADYHWVGEQMRRLSIDQTVAFRGSNWRLKVAGLVGVSRSQLDKCLQLRTAYPAASMKVVEEMGVGFARLTDVLGVEDAAARHELLRRAKAKRWSDEDVKAAKQSRKGKKRGKNAGRPRRAEVGHGLVADLGTLTSRTRDWVHFDEQVWSKRQYATELDRLLPGMPEKDRESLAEQVEKAKALLEELAGSSARALQVVTQLADRLTGPDSAAA